VGGGIVTLGPYSKVTNNPTFEGVWTGFTENAQGAYCLTTAEFHANLWRGYQTRCDPSYSFGYGTFLGTFDQFTSNAVNLTYDFVDFHDLVNPPDLVGETLTFSVLVGTTSGGASTLQLQLGDVGSTTTIKLVKVETMPTQTLLDIHLEGNAAAFVGQAVTDFKAAVATLLGIDARNIRVTDVRSGSIIVTVEIQDDAHASVSSTAAPAIIASQASINGLQLLGITNLTPGATSAAMHVVASWMVMLVVVVVAML
jgi:hypothetical protein